RKRLADPDVRSAARASATAAPALGGAEHLGEEVLEVAEDVPHPRAAEVEARAVEPRVAELVVAGALLRVGEDAERLGRLLELRLRGRVAGVAVGVVLQRRL